MFALAGRTTVSFILILFVLPLATAQPQDQLRGEGPTILALQPVKVADSDSDLRKLMKERYNTAAAQVKDLFVLYRAGRAPISDICYAIESFANTASELAETTVARVSELEMAMNVARAVERITSRKYDEGTEPLIAVQHARICRLGVEIQLLRAREAAKTARELAK